MVNWKDIHPDFTPELQKEWEDNGFDHRECKKWINFGLKPNEIDYGKWLRYVKFKWKGFERAKEFEWTLNHINCDNEELRIEYQEIKNDWMSIHPEFRELEFRDSWKNYGFSLVEIKSWIELGLDPKYDRELAAYARGKGYQPNQINREKLKKEYRKWKQTFQSDQEFLDFLYPKETREQTKYLVAVNKNLKGNLDLNDFFNLEELTFSGNNLANCNFLTTLPNPQKLIYLTLEDNKINQNLTVFSKFTNLKRLNISKNPFYGNLVPLGAMKNLREIRIANTDISGSLETLKGMMRLKRLYVGGTDLDSGVEYLPYSLNCVFSFGTMISYDTENRSSSKVREIKEQFELFYKLAGGKWIKAGFSLEEIKPWIDSGLETHEYNFANYLKKEKKINLQEVKNNLEKLRRKYSLEKELITKYGELSEKVIQQIKEFEHTNLTPEQELLVDKLIPSISELRINYMLNGLCVNCQQIASGKGNQKRLCQSCNINLFQQESKKLIDSKNAINFVQKSKLKWIPWEQFTNIELLAKGAFSKVYKAKWEKEDHIILKILTNSQDLNPKFFQEIAYHKLIENHVNDFESYIVPCYGISQDPQTNNYVMVMKYMKEGTINQYLKSNYKKLSFNAKLTQLSTVAQGLCSIHGQGLIHQDLHPGNILVNSKKEHYCYIADLGLSQPINETDKEKIYGVLRYVAPEVIREKKYTQSSDIYSFGIVAYEVLSGLTPYHDLNCDDRELFKKINEGLRPNLEMVQVPQLLKNLITRCWNTNPLVRPNSNEVNDSLDDCLRKFWDSKKDEEFINQINDLEETEETKKLLLSTSNSQVDYKVNSSITSSLLPNFPNPLEIQKNLSLQWRLQINSVKNEIKLLKEPLDNELSKLVEEFIQVNKKIKKDNTNDELRKELKELNKELKNKGLLREVKEKIINYCERLVELEQKQEEFKEKELQNQIEVPSKN